MKMTIRREELSRALYRVQGIADKKSSMPIVAHVLLEAQEDGILRVSATDMDVALTGSYKAEIETIGAVAVHARQLFDIVKSLPSDDVALELTENDWVSLNAGAASFRLVGITSNEFPEIPNYEDISTFSVPASVLSRMIDRTVFCVSTDDNRHNLGGVFCEAKDVHTLRMVATDGHRLAMTDKAMDDEIQLKAGVIVPRKGFHELRRVLQDIGDTDELVGIGFSGNNGVMKIGSVVLSTRLVEGQFPDYDQVIPRDGKAVVTIPRVLFGEALKRVSLVSQSRAFGVRLEIQPGQLDMVAEDPEFGNATERLEIQYEGEAITIAFNAKYILDVLQLIQDENVAFVLSDKLSPGVLRPAEEEGFLSVVMPMRF